MFQCCDLSRCWLEDSKNLHIGHVGVHTDVVRTVWWRLLGQVMNWHCLNWPKTVQIGNLPCKRAEGKFMSDTSHGLNSMIAFWIPGGGRGKGPTSGCLERKILKPKRSSANPCHMFWTRKDGELDYCPPTTRSIAVGKKGKWIGGCFRIYIYVCIHVYVQTNINHIIHNIQDIVSIVLCIYVIYTDSSC